MKGYSLTQKNKVALRAELVQSLLDVQQETCATLAGAHEYLLFEQYIAEYIQMAQTIGVEEYIELPATIQTCDDFTEWVQQMSDES